jgi:hypothetical protein
VQRLGGNLGGDCGGIGSATRGRLLEAAEREAGAQGLGIEAMTQDAR